MRPGAKALDGPPAGSGSVGVEETFRRFYQEHVGAVLGLVVALQRDVSAAEDITQEAFARAWRRWDRIGRLDRPGAWVRRVALNLARSRYRRLRTEIAGLARLGRPEVTVTDVSNDPAIWNEVRRLPRRQAEVIVLTYVDDLDSHDAAEVLGIDAATVRAHLTRARRTLEQRLEEPR